MADRVPLLAGGDDLRRHRRSAAQHHRPTTARPREGVKMAPEMDPASLELLEDGLRKTMLSASGADLDAALAELGWADMLSDMPDLAIPLVFRLLGETGSHASVLNDVLLETIGAEPGGTPPMLYAGGGWVVWERTNTDGAKETLGGLPLRRAPDGELMRLGEARRAL